MPDTAPVTVVPSAGFTPVVPTAAAYPPATTFPPLVALPSPSSSYPTSSYPPAVHPGAIHPTPSFPVTGTPSSTGGASGPARALGVGALVLGVFALLGAALPVVNIASIGLAAIGAGLGIAALFQLSRARGLALAGTIVSVVALTTSVAFATVYTGIVASASDGLFGDVGLIPGAVEDYQDETIASGDESGAIGTIDDPLPLGETIVVTRDGEPRWQITLSDPVYDAQDEVLAGNASPDVSSDLDGDAERFAYIAAEVTYLGEEPTSMYEEVYVCFSSAEEWFSCGGETLSVAPGTDLSLVEEVESGQTVEGNVLVVMPAGAEDEGRWAVAGQWTDFLYLAAR